MHIPRHYCIPLNCILVLLKVFNGNILRSETNCWLCTSEPCVSCGVHWFIGSLLCLRETLPSEVLPQQQPGTLGEKNATQLLSKEAQNSEDLCCPTAQSSQGTSATSNTQVKTSV